MTPGLVPIPKRGALHHLQGALHLGEKTEEEPLALGLNKHLLGTSSLGARDSAAARRAMEAGDSSMEDRRQVRMQVNKPSTG